MGAAASMADGHGSMARTGHRHRTAAATLRPTCPNHNGGAGLKLWFPAQFRLKGHERCHRSCGFADCLGVSLLRDHRAAGRAATAALLLGTALPALADPLTISGGQSTPVTTATAANNTPGDITISSSGSILVTGGVAATINSNNILTNGGSIGSSAASNSTAVLIDGTSNLTNANFINNGTISLNGTGGSGNIGILVANGSVAGSIQAAYLSSILVTGDKAFGLSVTAPFTGNIDVRTVNVSGTGSSAVAITAPVTGNVTVEGTTTNAGGGGYGVLVSAPITGRLSNGGSISVGTSAGYDTSGNAVAGLIANAGVRISANVGGGFLNDRYYIDSTGARVPTASVDTTVDVLVTSLVTSTGNAPTVWIGPDPSNPQPVTLGAVGTGADAYAIDNLGIIRSVAGNNGLATTALQIGGGGATTTLVGGITSQASSIIEALATDGTATAVSLQAGAVVPALVNAGNIDSIASQSAAAGSTPAGKGGSAYGIVIAPGASLPSITSSGIISATANGTGNTATAILDQSGTLASITNSGSISAIRTDTTVAARAIDLSAGTGPVTVTNSGTIAGDIVFGNGATTLALTGGSISGAIAFGSGNNTLALSNVATLSSPITSGAPLNITLADSSSLNLTQGPATINTVSATGTSSLIVPTRGTAPGLTVNGTASFIGASTVSLSLQSLALNQSIIVISAAGGLTTDHPATLLNGGISPYLFTSSAPTLTATTLSVDLTRKTAAEIGLSVGQGNLYNASIPALAANTPEAAAIANLPDQAAVVSAYRQITPPSFGHAAVRAAESFADSGFGAASERLASLADTRTKHSGDLGAWVQEIGDRVNSNGGTEETAFSSSTLGIAAGVDKPLLGLDAVGIAVLSSWTSVKQQVAPGLPVTPVQINSVGISPYAQYSWKSVFIQATALAARVTYSSTRSLSIGSVADTVGANWNGSQFGAGLTLGGHFRRGHFELTPTNSLYWTSLHQGGYTEIGGGAFNLAVDSMNQTLLTNTSRLSLTYLYPYGEGDLFAEVHGAYVHQFKQANNPTIAHFLTSGESITLPQEAENAEKYGYGGQLGYLQGPVKFVVGYDRRENSAYKDQQVALSATMSF